MSDRSAGESFMSKSDLKELVTSAEQEGSDFYELYISQRYRYGLSHQEALVALPMGISGYNMRELKARGCTLTEISALDDALYEINSQADDYQARVHMFIHLVSVEGLSIATSIARVSEDKEFDEFSWSNISLCG